MEFAKGSMNKIIADQHEHPEWQLYLTNAFPKLEAAMEKVTDLTDTNLPEVMNKFTQNVRSIGLAPGSETFLWLKMLIYATFSALSPETSEARKYSEAARRYVQEKMRFANDEANYLDVETRKTKSVIEAERNRLTIEQKSRNLTPTELKFLDPAANLTQPLTDDILDKLAEQQKKDALLPERYISEEERKIRAYHKKIRDNLIAEPRISAADRKLNDLYIEGDRLSNAANNARQILATPEFQMAAFNTYYEACLKGFTARKTLDLELLNNQLSFPQKLNPALADLNSEKDKIMQSRKDLMEGMAKEYAAKYEALYLSFGIACPKSNATLLTEYSEAWLTHQKKEALEAELEKLEKRLKSAKEVAALWLKKFPPIFPETEVAKVNRLLSDLYEMLEKYRFTEYYKQVEHYTLDLPIWLEKHLFRLAFEIPQRLLPEGVSLYLEMYGSDKLEEGMWKYITTYPETRDTFIKKLRDLQTNQEVV